MIIENPINFKKSPALVLLDSHCYSFIFLGSRLSSLKAQHRLLFFFWHFYCPNTFTHYRIPLTFHGHLQHRFVSVSIPQFTSYTRTNNNHHVFLKKREKIQTKSWRAKKRFESANNQNSQGKSIELFPSLLFRGKRISRAPLNGFEFEMATSLLRQ